MPDNSIRFVDLDEAGNPQSSLSDFSTPGLDDWVLLCDRQCQINPRLSDILARSAAERPDVALFFGDEIIIDSKQSGGFYFIYKSEIDVTQLIANDYIGWPLIVKASILRELLSFFDHHSGAFTYNLVLNALSSGHAIGRITEVLSARNDTILRSEASSRQQVLEQWITECYPDYEIRNGREAATFRLSMKLGTYPDVTIIVYSRLSRDHVDLNDLHVSKLLDSIAASHWPTDRLTVIIDSDCVAGTPFDVLTYPFDVKLVPTTTGADGQLSHAQKLNELWKHAETEHVIFMDDDLIAVGPDCISALLTFSIQDDVGGVGVGLLHPDGTVNHAGKGGGRSVAGSGAASPRAGYLADNQKGAEIHREWSMVTGPVFATRRSALGAVGGFDERFALALADVDLCMRMRILGLHIVYTPHAELTLAENASIGAAPRAGSDVALFIQRWRGLISDDPAYHPRLSRTPAFPHPLKAEPPLWVHARHQGSEWF